MQRTRVVVVRRPTPPPDPKKKPTPDLGSGAPKGDPNLDIRLSR
jgi:hypothetical protein